MNVSDLVDEVSRATRRSKRSVAPVVRALLKAIPAGIMRDGEVSIYGVGRFSVKKTREVTLNDRWSGEKRRIAPRDTVRFTPGRETVRAVRKRSGIKTAS